MRRLAQVDAAWLAVLLSYFAVFGGMLVYSDFLPFTFDNNESFAAYLHARNMYEFGIVSSSGLPDESLSNDAAAHPYLYTHAGASPRLFAYVIYVLGARTVELQLAVTAFTVGLLAFWFVYRFLADVSTRLYAVVACLLLLTDYIMFAQWHIGLWHVWKTLLLFGGLYLAHRVADKEQSRPLLMVYAFHVFLFYYETIFNVYVAAALFLYVILATRDYRLAAKFGLAQVAGALTAAIILARSARQSLRLGRRARRYLLHLHRSQLRDRSDGFPGRSEGLLRHTQHRLLAEYPRQQPLPHPLLGASSSVPGSCRAYAAMVAGRAGVRRRGIGSASSGSARVAGGALQHKQIRNRTRGVCPRGFERCRIRRARSAIRSWGPVFRRRRPCRSPSCGPLRWGADCSLPRRSS